MFLSRNKKNNVYPTPVNSSFTIHLGFKEVKIISACYRDGKLNSVINNKYTQHAVNFHYLDFAYVE